MEFTFSDHNTYKKNMMRNIKNAFILQEKTTMNEREEALHTDQDIA